MPDLKKDLTILIRTKLDTSERQVNYLQNQLNKMAKSLYLQINNISIAGQAMAQAMTTAGVTTANMSSSTSKGFQQTSQEVKNAGNALQWYHNLLQKVMHQYILQERTADTFVKSFIAVRQMADSTFSR
jgi:hypothetical protein